MILLGSQQVKCVDIANTRKWNVLNYRLIFSPHANMYRTIKYSVHSGQL